MGHLDGRSIQVEEFQEVRLGILVHMDGCDLVVFDEARARLWWDQNARLWALNGSKVLQRHDVLRVARARTVVVVVASTDHARLVELEHVFSAPLGVGEDAETPFHSLLEGREVGSIAVHEALLSEATAPVLWVLVRIVGLEAVVVTADLTRPGVGVEEQEREAAPDGLVHKFMFGERLEREVLRDKILVGVKGLEDIDPGFVGFAAVLALQIGPGKLKQGVRDFTRVRTVPVFGQVSQEMADDANQEVQAAGRADLVRLGHPGNRGIEGDELLVLQVDNHRVAVAWEQVADIDEVLQHLGRHLAVRLRGCVNE